MADHRSNFDPKKAAEDRKQEMKDITDRLEQGVSEIFQSEKYQQFLDTMAKFPQYSLNNNLLIMMQKPDATLCQSYTGWKQMGRFVKKGEKGIRILAPAPYKMEREQDKLDEKGKAILDKDGEPVKETVQINITAFKPVSTFDLSQTDGEPLPTIGASELTGSVEGYATLFEAIKEASPVPIGFEDIKGGAKGYFHTEENRIAIQEGMSEVQNVKTAIHEMAHAKLHNMEAQKAREDGGQTRSSKEVEAESVAYTVCQHFGIDTSDYSFAYVAGWSQGKEMPELKESLNTIRTAASELITAIDEKAQELIAEKEQTPQTLEEKLDQLAGELDQFAYDLDPYGYQDEAGSREEGLAQIQGMLKEETLAEMSREELEEYLHKVAVDNYNAREAKNGPEIMRELENLVMLKVVDSHWMEHLDAMDALREGIGLRAYGQRDPLVEYKFEAYDMFEAMKEAIVDDVVRYMYRVNVVTQPAVEDHLSHASVNNPNVDGTDEQAKEPVRAEHAVGRNDPCPCGSGKKYKNCCGKNS